MAILQTRRGRTVEYGGETMRVVGARGFETLTLEAKDGHIYDAPIVSLLEEKSAGPSKPIVVDARRIEKVPAYRAALMPLIEADKKTREDVRKAGELLGIKTTTAYACMARFEETGDINMLPPPTHPGGRGKSRLSAKAEEIIQKAIKEILLNRRQRRIKYFLETVGRRLAKASLRVSEATLRDRVSRIPPYTWKSKRAGYSDAQRTLDPLKGEAPEVTQPLELVQLDHWKVDLEILSDDRLTVIGRAWLTLAIDVYSRVVWGWHLSLDAPGTASTGFCMVRGMTRKELALKALGSKASMPFYGKPKRLHLDNAGEFRGNALAAGCKHHDIAIKFRPVEAPQYGAHIERLNGTLAGKMKDLPGATGSNTTQRKALRPEMTAAFTFDELQEQLVMMFDEYHNAPHSSLGCTPLEKWTRHYFGPEGQARPTPAIILDDLELRISWYPLKKCSLQRYGILVDYIKYYSEELDYLIQNSKAYGKVEVRRNPLDVREIYVLHPEDNRWMTVRCRHYLFPVATILELREAKREARRRLLQPTPENLARIIEEREAHAEQAQKKTKSAQRAATIRVNNAKLRAATPPTFDAADSGDGIQLLEPHQKQKTERKATPTRTKPQHDVDEFERAAEAAAGMSDEDIDAYIDA